EVALHGYRRTESGSFGFVLLLAEVPADEAINHVYRRDYHHHGKNLFNQIENSHHINSSLERSQGDTSSLANLTPSASMSCTSTASSSSSSTWISLEDSSSGVDSVSRASSSA